MPECVETYCCCGSCLTPEERAAGVESGQITYAYGQYLPRAKTP